MNKFWFRPKEYGFGAFPSTWEGWVLIGLFIVIVLWRSSVHAKTLNTPNFILEMILLAGVLIFVSKAKTDGEWQWHWGDRK